MREGRGRPEHKGGQGEAECSDGHMPSPRAAWEPQQAQDRASGKNWPCGTVTSASGLQTVGEFIPVVPTP